MYFKYSNIFLFLFCFLQVANAARFTDEQLREIYDGTNELSLRRFQALEFDVLEHFKKGRVNKFEVRTYLYEDEKYEKYQLTVKSMLTITEELPGIDEDILFEEFKDVMNRVLTNAARFTNQQLHDIYYGAKALSLRQFHLLYYLDSPDHFTGKVNRFEVRFYLCQDEKYKNYQLTPESMETITEELPPIGEDMTFDEFEATMNRVDL